MVGTGALFNVFAPPSPKPASTPGSTPATAFVEAAPPQLRTLAFLTTRSSFWAAGAATHTNFILKPTTLGFFNYLPFFIGLVLLLHLPGPPVLQRRLSGSSTIPVGVAPLSAVPRARDHNLTCCLPNVYNSFILHSKTTLCMGVSRTVPRRPRWGECWSRNGCPVWFQLGWHRLNPIPSLFARLLDNFLILAFFTSCELALK